MLKMLLRDESNGSASILLAAAGMVPAALPDQAAKMPNILPTLSCSVVRSCPTGCRTVRAECPRSP